MRGRGGECNQEGEYKRKPEKQDKGEKKKEESQASRGGVVTLGEGHGLASQRSRVVEWEWFTRLA